MFCEKCGSELPDNVKFCPKCGNDLSNVVSKKQIMPATSNTSSINDKWNSWSTGKKIIAVIAACCIGLLVLGMIGSILSPDSNTSSSSYDSDSYDYSSSSSYDSDVSDSGSSSSSSSSSSDDDYSYSSSSNGRDVSSHYEGDEGTQDTYGTFHDDGSVESHATGKTKYGNDYQIDSYMDSDGNVHGSVNIDGKTYTV